MPDYSGLLDNNYGLLTGISEGLKSGISGFREARHDIRDDEDRALDKQMKQKMYSLDLAKAGLQDTGDGQFHISPTSIEQKKRESEEKRSFEKFKSDLVAQEDRRKEQATFKRSVQSEYAKRNMIAQFDAQGNFVGAKPVSGLIGTGPMSAAASPEEGVNQGALRQMIDTGQISKEAGNKATDEFGKYEKMNSELEEGRKVFDIAKQNATFQGRMSRNINPHAFAATGGAAGGLLAGTGTMGVGLLPGIAGGTAAGEAIGQGLKNFVTLGDEKSKSYRGAVDPFIDKLTKDAAGRVTPISFEKISSVMPEQGDSSEVLEVKRQALERLIRSSYTFPTLKLRGLLNTKEVGSQKPSGTLTPDEQDEFEKLDAKYGKRK